MWSLVNHIEIGALTEFGACDPGRRGRERLCWVEQGNRLPSVPTIVFEVGAQGEQATVGHALGEPDEAGIGQ